MNVIKKYHPKTLKDFIGNKKITDALKNIAKKDYVPHIIISGEYGTGKTLLKNIFIKSLDINPNNILHVNLNEDLKKNNIKNNKLFNFLKKPVKNLIIIDNYEEIPLEQQYILRSFIKNYNNHSIFLIFLNNVTNIIEQLSNYFLIFKLKHNTDKEYMRYLNKIIKKEKLDIPEHILRYIIEISHNFREVINNFTIILHYYQSQKEIKTEDLEFILNISDKKHACNIIKFCDNKDIYSAIGLVDELVQNGYSITDLINVLTTHIKLIDDIKYEKKIKFIELISFAQIRMTNNLNTYPQLVALLAKMCKA